MLIWQASEAPVCGPLSRSNPLCRTLFGSIIVGSQVFRRSRSMASSPRTPERNGQLGRIGHGNCTAKVPMKFAQLVTYSFLRPQ
jgi:hypothetical protein